MFFRPHVPLLVAIVTFLVPLSGAATSTNHTVRCEDLSISYIELEDWQTPNDPNDVGGYHQLTQVPTAYALFSFTGVAFYFMSTKWPYLVTTDVTIDNRNTVKLDLQDYNSPHVNGGPGSVPAGIVGVFDGLQNGLHTVRISVHPGDPYAVVGGFLYTTIDSDTIPTSSSSDPPSPSSTPSSSSASSAPAPPSPTLSDIPTSNYNLSTPTKDGVRKITIGVGIVGGFLLTLLILFLVWCGMRWGRARQRRQDHVTPPGLQQAPSMSSNLYSGGRTDRGYYYQPGPMNGHSASPAPMSNLPPVPQSPNLVHLDEATAPGVGTRGRNRATPGYGSGHRRQGLRIFPKKRPAPRTSMLILD